MSLRVAYICRGYPGLGKVMGALTIHQRLALRPDYQGLFLSYDRGHAYLSAARYPCEDLLATGGAVARDGFCSPFAAESRRAVDLLEAFEPDVVVDDGEPYLVDITEQMLQVPTLVLAHPLDVENPGNEYGVRLFRHFYRRASKVVAHGLRRLSPSAVTLGGRAGQVTQINTLVRQPIWHAARAGTLACDGPAVCVLGGGSSNAAGPFLLRTIELGRWFLRACAELLAADRARERALERPIVFCADRTVHAALIEHAADSVPHAVLHATPVDNVEALTGAAVAVGRAGRNLASELLTLGKRAVLVPVSGARFRLSGQMRTATRASELSPAVAASLWDDGYAGFRDRFARQLERPSSAPVWQPGNEAVSDLFRELLASSQSQDKRSHGY